MIHSLEQLLTEIEKGEGNMGNVVPLLLKIIRIQQDALNDIPVVNFWDQAVEDALQAREGVSV